MSKRNPGEWYIDEDTRTHEGCDIVQHETVGPAKRRIAHVFGYGENASLITTAPRLLAALEDCLNSLEYIERNYPELTGYGIRQSRIDQAKKVIAKARGEG